MAGDKSKKVRGLSFWSVSREPGARANYTYTYAYTAKVVAVLHPTFNTQLYL